MFEPQVIELGEATTARLEARFGSDLEAMRLHLEETMGADVVRVVKDESGRLEAVLTPPLQEAIEDGADSFIGRATGLSGPDLIAGAILAVLSGLGVMRYRRGLLETMPPGKKPS